MKALSIILAVILLASCSGMGQTSGAGSTGESMSGPGTTQMNNQNNFPSSIYFGD